MVLAKMATPLIGPLLLLPLLLHWTADAEPAAAACAGSPADSAASAEPGSRGSRALGLDRFRGGGRESFVAGEKKSLRRNLIGRELHWSVQVEELLYLSTNRH